MGSLEWDRALIRAAVATTATATATPVAWMHHYRKIGGGSRYEEADVGPAPGPDPSDGYQWYRSDPLYAATPAPSTSWISVKDQLPPRHTDVWCFNRDGEIFRGRICAGMHKPFFTLPRGDGSPSNTAPDWIDVTHWMLPQPPEGT